MIEKSCKVFPSTERQVDRLFRLLLSFCGNQRKESRERHGKDIGRVGEEVMKQGGKMCVVGRFPTECSFLY